MKEKKKERHSGQRETLHLLHRKRIFLRLELLRSPRSANLSYCFRHFVAKCLSQVFRKSSLCPGGSLYKYNSVNYSYVYRETVADYCMNYTNRNISVRVAITAGQTMDNLEFDSLQWTQTFLFVKTFRPIWDALSSMDSGNTCIDVHLVV